MPTSVSTAWKIEATLKVWETEIKLIDSSGPSYLWRVLPCLSKTFHVVRIKETQKGQWQYFQVCKRQKLRAGKFWLSLHLPCLNPREIQHFPGCKTFNKQITHSFSIMPSPQKADIAPFKYKSLVGTWFRLDDETMRRQWNGFPVCWQIMYDNYKGTHKMLAAHYGEDTMCAKWQSGLGSASSHSHGQGAFGDIYLNGSGQEMLFLQVPR